MSTSLLPTRFQPQSSSAPLPCCGSLKYDATWLMDVPAVSHWGHRQTSSSTCGHKSQAQVQTKGDKVDNISLPSLSSSFSASWPWRRMLRSTPSWKSSHFPNLRQEVAKGNALPTSFIHHSVENVFKLFASLWSFDPFQRLVWFVVIVNVFSVWLYVE